MGLAEIGGDMRGAALESPARSLRCSEGVIGRLLFLSPPLPSPASLSLFKLQTGLQTLSSSSFPFESLNMHDRYERRERLQRGRGMEKWRGGIQVKDSR